MKKWFSFLCCLMLAAILLVGCSPAAPAAKDNDKLNVAVSFDAMKEFTQAVGKDKINIITMIPDGTEPHDFQPTTKNMKDLQQANVFIYNGFGMEPWAEKTLKSIDKKDLVAVNASQGIDPIVLKDEKERKEHGNYDPHCFLSLVNAQIEVKNIADALAKADPKNADFYQKNAADYNAQLQQLYAEYKQKFQAVPNKQFVTGHAAFGYLCRDFGLTQTSVESVFADGEPTTQQLANLVEYCKTHHVKTIFTEDMVSPKTSQTLANEVGAAVKTIHTMESSEGSATYMDRMKEDLNEIYTSLQ